MNNQLVQNALFSGQGFIFVLLKAYSRTNLCAEMEAYTDTFFFETIRYRELPTEGAPKRKGQQFCKVPSHNCTNSHCLCTDFMRHM